MSSIAIIYWSGTGNTEQMANAICEGIKKTQPECKLFSVSEISAEEAAKYDKLVLGCSSMGAEVLEEEEFEPFYTALEENISGKKIALFGSYGWGDGEWMRDWQERVKSKSGILFNDEGLIINETPDEAGLKLCVEFGGNFAEF